MYYAAQWAARGHDIPMDQFFSETDHVLRAAVVMQSCAANTINHESVLGRDTIASAIDTVERIGQLVYELQALYPDSSMTDHLFTSRVIARKHILLMKVLNQYDALSAKRRAYMDLAFDDVDNQLQHVLKQSRRINNKAKSAPSPDDAFENVD